MMQKRRKQDDQHRLSAQCPSLMLTSGWDTPEPPSPTVSGSPRPLVHPARADRDREDNDSWRKSFVTETEIVGVNLVSSLEEFSPLFDGLYDTKFPIQVEM